MIMIANPNHQQEQAQHFCREMPACFCLRHLQVAANQNMVATQMLRFVQRFIRFA